MHPFQSKLTSQGRMSASAAIRQLLNLTPGAVLEWSDEDGGVSFFPCTVAQRCGTAEVHTALNHFRAKPDLGFSDCPVFEIARKVGHPPLGKLDRGRQS